MAFPRFSGAPSSSGATRAVTLMGFPGRDMILAASSQIGRLHEARINQGIVLFVLASSVFLVG